MNWFEEGAGPGLVEARGALGLLAMPDGLPRAFHVRSNSQERPLRFGQINGLLLSSRSPVQIIKMRNKMDGITKDGKMGSWKRPVVPALATASLSTNEHEVVFEQIVRGWR